MAIKRLETQLTIRAVDKYSGLLKNMRSETGRFADGVRSDLRGLQQLRGPLKLIEDFRKQQRVLRQSGRDLDSANRRVRELARQMDAGGRSSARLRREFEAAQKRAVELANRHARNGRVLATLQGQLRQAGVSTAHLAKEESRLAAELDKANDAFGRLFARLQRLDRMYETIAAARKRMDRSLATAANLSFVGSASIQSGRQLLQGLRAPVAAAVEFETAMSDVRKVVDFDGPAAFKKMSDDILDLSTRIPMAAEGLAEIVAAGGQSGLASGELLQFAEMAAKIGVAFDISADHAGTSMAKIKTAMRLTLEDTGALFDAMNHVSNNSAARADQTLDFLNRAAAEGENYGFDATETLAFGSAMIAAGAGADTAATSFRNMGRALTRGESATARQREAYRKLGLDASEVAERMQGDAVTTAGDILDRLRGMEDHLRASVMSDLFGDEARELTKLINNAELLPDLLGMVAKEQSYLGSAEKEYAARASTTANNLQLMQNQLSRLGVTLGELILPHLNEFLEVSQGIVETVVDWAKRNPKLTKGILLGAGALGAMAVAGGALLTAGAGLIGTLAVLRFGLAGLGARAVFAAADLVGVGRALGGIARLPKMALSSLIVPLKWTASLLPSFAPALARFAGFRRDAGREITNLSKTVEKRSDAMRRSLSRVRWGAASAGIMAFSALSSVPKNPEDLAAFQEKNVRQMEATFRSLPGISHLMKGYESLFEQLYGRPAPIESALLPQDAQVRSAALTVQKYAAENGLPTEERLGRLRADAQAYREAVKEAKAALDAAPEFASGILNPLREQARIDFQAAQQGLQKAEAKLAAASSAAEELSQALAVLSDAEVAPEINVASIDAALEKVRELASTLSSMGSEVGPSREAPKPAGKRALGGPVRAGLPYLINEDTPRSEWFVPRIGGGVLNASQAKAAFRQFLGSVSRIGQFRQFEYARRGLLSRAAGLAAASSAAFAAPAVAQPAAAPSHREVHVSIGSVTIPVAQNVSRPEDIAKMAADYLGQHVDAALAANFSD